MEKLRPEENFREGGSIDAPGGLALLPVYVACRGGALYRKEEEAWPLGRGTSGKQRKEEITWRKYHPAAGVNSGRLRGLQRGKHRKGKRAGSRGKKRFPKEGERVPSWQIGLGEPG